MAARVTPNPSCRFSAGRRSAIIALLAVWKSGQPNALSRATSAATCQSSVTNAKPTNQTTPTSTDSMMTTRRPSLSVRCPPQNCTGITASGTRPKTTPIIVIEVRRFWRR